MKTRVKWGIALRLGVLLASFSVFAAILAGYYSFDSSRERLPRIGLVTPKMDVS